METNSTNTSPAAVYGDIVDFRLSLIFPVVLIFAIVCLVFIIYRIRRRKLGMQAQSESLEVRLEAQNNNALVSVISQDNPRIVFTDAREMLRSPRRRLSGNSSQSSRMLALQRRTPPPRYRSDIELSLSGSDNDFVISLNVRRNLQLERLAREERPPPLYSSNPSLHSAPSAGGSTNRHFEPPPRYTATTIEDESSRIRQLSSVVENAPQFEPTDDDDHIEVARYRVRVTEQPEQAGGENHQQSWQEGNDVNQIDDSVGATFDPTRSNQIQGEDKLDGDAPFQEEKYNDFSYSNNGDHGTKM